MRAFFFSLARVALPLCAASLLSGCGSRATIAPAGKLPEQLVYARSDDQIVNGGAMFAPREGATKPVAVLWVPGWGVNFYHPAYVSICRALAERGHACLSVNTRMHDLGTIAGERDGKRIRGGGYWGVPSEEVRDLAAWIAFAGAQGYAKVVLVGHSAGWAAVRHYQADTRDPRVVGVVLASGAVRVETRVPDADQLAQATRMMAEGRGDDLVRDPKRSFPSFVSAATFLDIANTPPEFKDFFGVRHLNPAVTRIRCPLLAFFGTRESDVGGAAELEMLKAAVARQSVGPERVDTVMIRGADHMYQGEESQVAETIAHWLDSLQAADVGRGHASGKS